MRQICNYLPPFLVPQIARTTETEGKSRSFSPWCHVVSLLYGQLGHSLSLNDLCAALQWHTGPLVGVRGAPPPSRQGLSNANRERPAELAEQLFWQVLGHLGKQTPGFVQGRSRGAAFRFKVPVHVVATTVMELMANCMDWTHHRRQNPHALEPAKPPAKLCHH